MADMTAFERQLAARLELIAGPEPYVDAMASARTARSIASTRRPFTMFSALKFVTACVIVALFGGFLLAGILTEPQPDEALPAAVTESPSPTTTEGLLSGMVTEEVEPGVYRVINDGVRDMGSPPGEGLGEAVIEAVVTGDGGAVWRVRAAAEGSPRRSFRLGAADERSTERLDADYDDETTPDRRVVMAEAAAALFLEPESLKQRDLGLDLGIIAVERQDDGTLWLLGFRGMDYGGGLVRVPPSGQPEVLDWTKVYEGFPDALAVTPDGEAWLLGRSELSAPGWNPMLADVFLHFDGAGWEVLPVPEGVILPGWGRPFDVGPDDVLWMAGDATFPHGSLARYDESGWTVFGEVDGVRPWGGPGWSPQYWSVDMVRIAPDGSVWVNAAIEEGDCDGLGRFDGETWSSYLADTCIDDYDFAPDGAVWVVAQHYWAYPGTQTFVITPEAVATSD